MITFDRVDFRYPDAERDTLRGVNLSVPEAELALVVGATGSGKSTLLRAVNGLVPHFSGGVLRGTVAVDGRSTSDHPPRELADLVGFVGQDPLAGFVTDTVEEELAYGMEQLAIPARTMRSRVEQALDLLGIAGLRGRALRTLSGGQQQRVAIGSVLAAGCRVLVLDEPTSALDPTSAEEVLAALLRLVHDVGVTVLLAEHRLERVVEYADRVLYLPGDGRVMHGPPEQIVADIPIAPPIVELGRLAGWEASALSVRDARRRAATLRERLAVVDPTGIPRRASAGAHDWPDAPPAALVARHVTVRYGDVVAVRDIRLDLAPGAVTALMGRNGSGKSSLLWALDGAMPGRTGTVRIGGTDVGPATSAHGPRPVGLVPQTPADLLYQETVAQECGTADAQAHRRPGSCAALLEQIVPGIPAQRHPRDLSEGQQLALVLAIQLTASPPVLLLDEPTRGLDYGAKRALGAVLASLAAAGRIVVVATHDVEFAASFADRVIVLATGEIVADGPVADVLADVPAFAPQVAKALAPQRWLTVEQVRRGLQIAGGTP